MKPRRRLDWELDAPRLLQLEVAILDAVETQPTQYVCQWVAGDRDFGRTVKHNGVSSMETPGSHSLCCSAAKCCAANKVGDQPHSQAVTARHGTGGTPSRSFPMWRCKQIGD